MGKRIKWVDLAKGIGIILVVYGHVILGVHDAGLSLNGLNYNLQHSFIYTFHMPLFFFLSGLFAKRWVGRPTKVALSQKMRTLLFPYIVWGIIQGIIMALFSSSTNGSTNFIDIIKLPIQPFGQFWFVYDLFWIFLLFYVMEHLFKLSLKKIFLLSFILCFVSQWISIWQFGRIFYYLPFFIAGVYLGPRQLKFKKPVIISGFILFIFINLLRYFVNWGGFQVVVDVLTAFTGILLVIMLVQKFDSKLLSYIGRRSLDVYLLHIMATAGTRIILMKLGVDLVVVHLLLGTVMGVLGPIIAVEFFKKINIYKYLF
ncbi:acyltransferase family protein [Pediococcus siamensis]|uniref:acyltransferase family protein n=1 Tax=Pediococcus siamensis TaxID=381829 RepID=UPI0039A228A1